MDLELLELFAGAARLGNFAALARERSVSPSAISRGISTLEEQLGVRLFQRSTRSLALTEAGERYLARVVPALEELARARDELAEDGRAPAGLVRITSSVTFAHTRLLPLLPAFREALPGIELEVLATDTNLDLVAERIDIAIRLAESFRADVIGVRLFPTTYGVVASPDWVARQGAMAHPSELAGVDCLRFTLPDFRTRWLFRPRRGGGEVVEVPVHGSLLLSSAWSLLEAARLGLGPCLMAEWLSREDEAVGRLVRLFPEWEASATTFGTAAWLLYPSRAFMPRKVRATIDFLRERLV